MNLVLVEIVQVNGVIGNRVNGILVIGDNVNGVGVTGENVGITKGKEKPNI